MAIGVNKFNFGDGQGAREINPLSTAPVFSSSTAYAVGDYCYHDGLLYKCTTAHTGVWNSSNFETVTIGAEINDIKSDLSDLDTRVEALEEGGGSGDGLTDFIKTALLQIAQKVAYIDDDGQTYYDALESALYPGVDSITCVYTQSGTVYTTDSLASLKSDLVVTAHYADSSMEVLPDTAYTLSGTLTAGTSTISVVYGSHTATFNVTVTEAYSVTNALTNVINSNSATSVTSGESYTATLTASSQQGQISSVTITMGETDITSTAYDNGTISIANVTGNIVITALAYLAYYDTADSDMTIVNGGWEPLTAISGELLSNTSNQNSRRSLYVDSGEKPVYRGTQSSYSLSSYYPIPVPAGATSVTVSCDVSTHYNAVGVEKLTAEGYTAIGYSDWMEGTATLEFDSDSDLYIMTNSKRSNGYNYNTSDPAPTRFIVTFM